MNEIITEKIGTNIEKIDEFPEIIPEKITEKNDIEAKIRPLDN